MWEKHLKSVLLLVCAIFACTCGKTYENKGQPEAVKGVLDLRGWDFREQGPVDLNGEWQFYWNELLEPADFTNPRHPLSIGYLNVPGNWENHILDTKKLPRDGYATYRLMILLDVQPIHMAFDMSEAGKAFVLYANGDQISTGGVVGTSAQTTTPEAWEHPAFYSVNTDRIDIIIQVANFHGGRGGIQNAIVFGPDRQVYRSRGRFRFMGTFIFGTLFIMGLYHLGLYLIRRKDKSPLYFNIVCFFLALYTFLQVESIQFINPRSVIFLSITWELRTKLAAFALFLTIPFFSMFINTLYQREFSKSFLLAIQSVGVLFSIAAFSTTLRVLYIINQVFQFISIVAGLYILYVLILAFRRKREGALVFLTGYVVLLSAGISDVFNVSSTIQLVPAAIIIFIITQALFMSYRYSNALRTMELQSDKLRKEISDRKKAEEQSKLHQQQLIQADKMASLGILVSGVAHEINNPNNYILLNSEMLSQAWNDVTPILQEYYESHGEYKIAGIPYSEARERILLLLSGITDGAKRIENIITVLRNFSRHESGERQELLNINNVVEASLLIVNTLINKSTNRFTVTLGNDLPPFTGNFQRLEQVFINLITNACQALSDKNKALSIITSYNSDAHRNIIEITDEGIGISPEHLNHIMDPFFTTKRDAGGTGLGLSISYTIIKEHGGDISFSSTPGMGTTVQVSLPVNKIQ